MLKCQRGGFTRLPSSQEKSLESTDQEATKKHAQRGSGYYHRLDIDAPKKINNELEAVELVRISEHDSLNHNEDREIPYKIIVRSRYDQYILYPKRKVEYMGEILDVEDLFCRFVNNIL
jgi:hypothetical protein